MFKNVILICIFLSSFIYANNFEDILKNNPEFKQYQKPYNSLMNTFSEMKILSLNAKNEKLKTKRLSIYNKYHSMFMSFPNSSKIEVIKMFEPIQTSKINKFSALQKIVDLVYILDEIDKTGVKYDKKQFDRTFKYLARTSVKEPMIQVLRTRIKAKQKRIMEKDKKIKEGEKRIMEKDAENEKLEKINDSLRMLISIK